MGINVTTYKGGRDNAYPGNPDGGNDTTSGVPLNPKYATFAIPGKWHGHPGNENRTNLKLGDVVMLTNTVTDKDGKTTTYKSLGWATDFGGMPHGDLDIAQGSLEKNLGLTCVTNTKPIYDKYSKQTIPAGEYALDTKGQGDISAERVMHVSAKGFKNPNAVNEAILKVNEKIKSGELKPEDAQQALAAEINDPANVMLADEESKKVQVASRSGGYGTYEDAHGEGRRPTGGDLADTIQDMMKDDPMMAILLLLVGLFTGSLNMSDLTSPGVSEPVRNAARQIPDAAIQKGKEEIKQGVEPARAAVEVLGDVKSTMRDGILDDTTTAHIANLSPKTQAALAMLAGKFHQATGHDLIVTEVRSPDKFAVVDGKAMVMSNNDPETLEKLNKISSELGLKVIDAKDHYNIEGLNNRAPLPEMAVNKGAGAGLVAAAK